ncbi:MAG: hypothetical protein GQF41_3360 [Candidatus Rifleibacterium amylolyticum]|nr:MAG: hypothetical protein GQF41_3360 [Candidatus Rifleibacterium amylolyticum]
MAQGGENLTGRILFLLVLGVVLLLPVIWNAGAIELTGIDSNYVVRVYGLPTADQKGYDGFYALKLKELIEKTASPSRNPIVILYQHICYNAVTDGYDIVFWLEPNQPGSPGRSYGCYLSGKTLFLRVEYDGWNRVLSVPFEKAKIETALQHLPAEETP